MTEQEWLTSTDWLALWHRMGWGEQFDRKRRLIATAICRQFTHLLTHPSSVWIMDMSETVADRQAPEGGWEEWVNACGDAEAAASAANFAAQHAAACFAAALENDNHKIGRALEYAPTVFGLISAIKAGILAGDASIEAGQALAEHPVVVMGRDQEGGKAIANVIREIYGNPFRPVAFSPDWRSDTAMSLAKHMYETRDFSAMPILADALQDAGCDNDDILNHCRDEKLTHVRGCWVVDLVLGKS